jgi:hypothetical protein
MENQFNNNLLLIANQKIEILYSKIYETYKELKRHDAQWYFKRDENDPNMLIFKKCPFFLSFQWFNDKAGCNKPYYLFIGLFEENLGQLPTSLKNKQIDEIRLEYEIDENESIIWYDIDKGNKYRNLNDIFIEWKEKLLKKIEEK